MEVKGKVAVISGAGSGIGKALAIKLAEEGANLAISDINGSYLDETAEQCRNFGKEVHTSVLDVSDWDAYQSYASAVIAKFGHIDIVVNNAGVALGPFTVEEVRMEEFEWLMSINFWGMVYGTKVFLPHLRKRTEACLANISSILGIGAISKQSPYCASKFAIRGFTESLRMEAAVDFPQVNVLSIHPGGIQTNIVRHARWNDDRVPKAEKDEMNAEFEKTFINTPQYAAKGIFNAIRKDKKRLLIGNDAKRIARIIKWFPVRYTKIILRGAMNKTVSELAQRKIGDQS